MKQTRTKNVALALLLSLAGGFAMTGAMMPAAAQARASAGFSESSP